jgi:hypothetical protein
VRPTTKLAVVAAASALIFTATACTDQSPHGAGVIDHTHSPSPSPSPPKTYPINGTNPTIAKNSYIKRYQMNFHKHAIAAAKTTTYVSNNYSISPNVHLRAMFTVKNNASNGPLIDITCLAQGNKGKYMKHFTKIYEAVEECLTLLLPKKKGKVIGTWLASELPRVDRIAKEKRLDGLTVSIFVNRSKSSPHQAVKAEIENKE